MVGSPIMPSWLGEKELEENGNSPNNENMILIKVIVVSGNKNVAITI